MSGSGGGPSGWCGGSISVAGWVIVASVRVRVGGLALVGEGLVVGAPIAPLMETAGCHVDGVAREVMC